MILKIKRKEKIGVRKAIPIEEGQQINEEITELDNYYFDISNKSDYQWMPKSFWEFRTFPQS